ncbi:hypothetical protein FSP39_011904 [Pinctada imbricata]|uniref:G-protein coupled receptors family 1 profile domain-containing protein n=1 Tax=Pinctada imbricata TaxID=66713 RepID=A0AA89C763_PINIB|nr:hypothetical protein FSP39_011904 [Pinctada imbricata]
MEDMVKNKQNDSVHDRGFIHGDHIHHDIAEWNYEFAHKVLPNTCLYVLFVILGITGNLLIISIYQTRFHRKREGRFYIVILAVVDLLHCVASSALVFVKNIRPLTFPDSVTCKLLLYSTNWFFILSLFILLLISIERYIKVCKPFTSSMSRRIKYLTVAGMAIFAAFIPIPRLVYFQVRDLQFGPLIGHICGPNMELSGANIVIPGVLYFNFIMSFAVIITLTVLYSLVGRVICRQNNRFRRASEQSGSTDISRSLSDQNCPQCDSGKVQHSRRSEQRMVYCEKCAFTAKYISRSSAHKAHPNLVGTLSNGRKRTKSLAQIAYESMKVNRLTIMFMMITLVTILSYIPLWIFVLLDVLNPRRWFLMSDYELHLFYFLRTLSVVSYLSNPFIYAYYDRMFRQTVMRVFFGYCQNKRSTSRFVERSQNNHRCLREGGKQEIQSEL